MKLLVFGAGGQLGSEFAALANAQFDIIGLGSKEADICDANAIRTAIDQHTPDAVINCAAYTAVDQAESEREQAFAVNSDAVKLLALACKAAALPLLHVSTDYVFDGEKSAPYTEQDQSNPQGVYGASKLAGEALLQATWERHVILRVSWVFGLHGGNFVKTMLRLAAERDELSVVNDQFGAPTAAASIAKNLLSLAQQATQPELPAESWGVYHLPSQPYTDWHAFATHLLREAHERGLITDLPTIHAISTEQYPTPAQRPANSRLASERNSRQDLKLEACDWPSELSTMMAALG